MAHLPLTTVSGNGSSSPNDSPASQARSSLESSERPSDDLDVLTALRQALVEGTRPPASIIHATAEFARILTGASGVALALRVNGTIVCRARSGDIAPEVGSPLSEDSGISGQCLRTATTLICNDAATDTRVDPDVCHALGLRSIAAIPLCSRMGVSGILEAFSNRPYAFDDEAVRSLRGLAEIAVAAHEREIGPPQTSHLAQETSHLALVPPLPIAPEPFAAPPPVRTKARVYEIKSRVQQVFQESLPVMRRYWIAGAAVAVLLLILVVARFSWRTPTRGLAASRPPTPVLNAAGTSSITPLNPAPSKPPSGIAVVRSDKSRTTGVMQNAAQIETAEPPATDSPANSSSPSQPVQGTTQSTTQSAVNEPPPAVEVAAAAPPTNLPGFTSGSVTLPTLEARVSDVTQAVLIRKVDPVYPPQARSQRLAGSVVMDTTIAENGTVREIKVVSGTPLLADAATRAVRQWRYSPLLLNGTPVAVQKRITVVFTLP